MLITFTCENARTPYALPSARNSQLYKNHSNCFLVAFKNEHDGFNRLKTFTAKYKGIYLHREMSERTSALRSTSNSLIKDNTNLFPTTLQLEQKTWKNFLSTILQTRSPRVDVAYIVYSLVYNFIPTHLKIFKAPSWTAALKANGW